MLDIVIDNMYPAIFKPALLCLTRIYESIDFWQKEYGIDGYFRNLEQVYEFYEIDDQEIMYTDTTFD